MPYLRQKEVNSISNSKAGLNITIKLPMQSSPSYSYRMPCSALSQPAPYSTCNEKYEKYHISAREKVRDINWVAEKQSLAIVVDHPPSRTSL
jgi:hypothetical protein